MSTKAEEVASVSEVPAPDRCRQLLVCLLDNCDKESSSSQRLDAAQRKKLEISVGKELSQILLEKNGLAHLFIACDDLGGESFWQNSAALSAIVQLLSRKPGCVKSADKYFAYILRHLLLLYKDRLWNKKMTLLFPLAMDKFQKVASHTVFMVNVLDKLTRPFDLLLERGNLNRGRSEDVHETSDSSFGLWNKHLDESLWTIARWSEALPSTSFGGGVLFHEHMLRLLPFWMHLLGQARDHEELVDDGLLKDLTVIQQRLFQTSFSGVKNRAEYLAKEIFLAATSDNSNRHAFFELRPCRAKQYKSSMVQLVEETLEEKEGMHYPSVSITVREEEAFSVQDIVDFKFGAMNEYLKNLPKEESGRFLFSLLNAVFERCQDSPIGRSNVDTNVADSSFAGSSFRFVQMQEGVLAGSELRARKPKADEDDAFLPHYVLTRLIELLAEFDFTALEQRIDERNILEMVEVAESISDCYKNKLCSSDGGQMSKPVTPRLDDFLEELESEEPAICGHALIELGRAFQRRDIEVFGSEAERLNFVYDRILDKLRVEDTYIFLASINALAELAYWKTDSFLERLVELFVTGMENSDEASEGEESQRKMMIRCKLGEALAKIFKQLGDFSPMYFDKVSSKLLAIVEHSKDPMIRASALSGLADLVVACRGRYFDKILQELLLCVSQLLSSIVTANDDDFKLVRRAAIHLLRSMVVSAIESSIFQTFANSLTSITRELKKLWRQDEDEVVRFHSELALLEIQDAMRNSFQSGGGAVGMRRIIL